MTHLLFGIDGVVLFQNFIRDAEACIFKNVTDFAWFAIKKGVWCRYWQEKKRRRRDFGNFFSSKETDAF
jgi:hypothetical protein